MRAFKAVGGTPRFITEAHGCWLTDADGNRYVDLVCSWGPMILGHAHPAVVDAVAKAASTGLSFGAPTRAETELATEIIDRMPPVERLRLVNFAFAEPNCTTFAASKAKRPVCASANSHRRDAWLKLAAHPALIAGTRQARTVHARGPSAVSAPLNGKRGNADSRKLPASTK